MKRQCSSVRRLLSLLPTASWKIRSGRRRFPQGRRLAAEQLEPRWLLESGPIGGLSSLSGEAENLILVPQAGAAVEIRAEVRLVTSPAAADHRSDASFASYASVTAVPLNSTYYAEIWLRDIGTLRGIVGGTLDLAYTTPNADATAIDHGAVFNVLTSGTTDDANGLVDNLGGGTFSGGEGIAQWVRLATITFNSTAAGDVTFVPGHDLPLGASNSNFAEVGAGILDWSQIEFNSTPTTVRQLPQHPWCNFRQAEDVDDDGHVKPLDVLIIINHINAFEAGPLPVPPPDPGGPPPYLDVNGDDSVTAGDVLSVINFLNRDALQVNVGEAESVAPVLVDHSSPFPEETGPTIPPGPQLLVDADQDVSRPDGSCHVAGGSPVAPVETGGRLANKTMSTDVETTSGGNETQVGRRDFPGSNGFPRRQKDISFDDPLSSPGLGEFDELLILLAADVAQEQRPTKITWN